MSDVTVVGSGASGVHFAATALAEGMSVTLVDVGHRAPGPVAPEATFAGLKRRLPDPVAYFLGEDFEGALLPGREGEYYGFPPSKEYVFRGPPEPRAAGRGFAPLFSFARGGLAEAWTAGCYPFTDDEMVDFPWPAGELAPFYGEVARRIGVTGEADDLARFFPVHDGLLPPLPLDPHSERLLAGYARRRERLNRRRVFVGRTRVATLSRPHAGREPCDELGRCLWGCPVGALYTPAHTLGECLRRPRFDYRPGLFVRRFVLGAGGRARGLVARRLDGGGEETLPVERLVLAAGTLSSARLLLASLAADGGGAPELAGLTDNRQLLLPFVSLGMLGRRVPERAYQYHLLGMAIEGEEARTHVHGQITTLTSALLHPIVEGLPCDLATALALGRGLRPGLGLLNLSFHDTRRADNRVALEPDPAGREPRLALTYRPPAGEDERIRRAGRRARRALRALGGVVAPGMSHLRPMGSSVHYSGTVPMSAEARPWTTTPGCRSREVPNVWLVDGSVLPFLPAKNLTFTLMANAVRVAGRIAGGA